MLKQVPEIFIGADHRGFELKGKLFAELSQKYQVADLGPAAYDPADDYNDVAVKVARAVAEHAGSRGILVCGSGNGVSIQANRFKGVRAIAPTLSELVKLGREHNDANVLCLSADFLDYNKVAKLSNIFLNTDFSGEERHIRRNKKLDEEV